MAMAGGALSLCRGADGGGGLRASGSLENTSRAARLAVRQAAPERRSGAAMAERGRVRVQAKGRDAEDDVWRRKSLTELERELLGIDAAGDAAKSKKKADMAEKGEDDGKRPRKADGSEWSMLDEVESQLDFSFPALDNLPIAQKLQSAGEWLEKKTTIKEEYYGAGLLVLFGMFPLWLGLVLVAFGVVHLPEPLAQLERLLTETPS